MMDSLQAITYRGVWSAVIVQAFADLRPRVFTDKPPVIKPSGDDAKDIARLAKLIAMRDFQKKAWKRSWAEAMAFIFSDETAPRSFLWICDCLELNPEYLRKLALSEEGIKKVLTGKSL